jgi:hypothetical protein
VRHAVNDTEVRGDMPMLSSSVDGSESLLASASNELKALRLADPISCISQF